MKFEGGLHEGEGKTEEVRHSWIVYLQEVQEGWGGGEKAIGRSHAEGHGFSLRWIIPSIGGNAVGLKGHVHQGGRKRIH